MSKVVSTMMKSIVEFAIDCWIRNAAENDRIDRWIRNAAEKIHNSNARATLRKVTIC